MSLVFLIGFVVLLLYSSWHVSARVSAQMNPKALQAIHWGLLNGGRSRGALAAFTQWLVDGTVVWNETERKYELGPDETHDPSLALVHAGAPFKQVLQSLEENLVPYERQLQNWGLWCDDQTWKERERWTRMGLWMLGGGFVIYAVGSLIQDRHFPSLTSTFLILSSISTKKVPRQTREAQNLLRQFKGDHSFVRGEIPESMLPHAVAMNGANALYDSPHALLIWVLATQT